MTHMKNLQGSSLQGPLLTVAEFNTQSQIALSYVGPPIAHVDLLSLLRQLYARIDEDCMPLSCCSSRLCRDSTSLTAPHERSEDVALALLSLQLLQQLLRRLPQVARPTALFCRLDHLRG